MRALSDVAQRLNRRSSLVAQREVAGELSTARVIPHMGRAAGQAAFPASRVVQREPITAEAAWEYLGTLGTGLTPDNTTIEMLWDDEWGDANCHGYTVSGEAGEELEPLEFAEQVGQLHAATFFRGDALAHSGRLDGGTLTHLLIGVGVCRSEIGDGLMGYDARFDLPAQREDFDALIEPVRARAQLRRTVEEYTRKLSTLASSEVAGAEDLYEALWNLYDYGEDDKDDLFERAQAMIVANAGLLEGSSDDDGN